MRKRFSNKKEIRNNAIIAECFYRYFVLLKYIHSKICCWNYYVLYQRYSAEIIIHKKKCIKWTHLSTQIFQMEYQNSLLLLSGFILVSRNPFKNINLHTVQQLMKSYVWNSFLVTSSKWRHRPHSLGHANIWATSKNVTWTSNGNRFAIYNALCAIQMNFKAQNFAIQNNFVEKKNNTIFKCWRCLLH